LRLYLDACCLNRLTDDQNQSRVRNEAETVERILLQTKSSFRTRPKQTVPRFSNDSVSAPSMRSTWPAPKRGPWMCF
jgi:hypothetical protein